MLQVYEVAVAATVTHLFLLFIGMVSFRPLNRRLWRLYDNGKFPAAVNVLGAMLYLFPTFVFFCCFGCWFAATAGSMVMCYILLFAPAPVVLVFFLLWLWWRHESGIPPMDHRPSVIPLFELDGVPSAPGPEAGFRSHSLGGVVAGAEDFESADSLAPMGSGLPPVVPSSHRKEPISTSRGVPVSANRKLHKQPPPVVAGDAESIDTSTVYDDYDDAYYSYTYSGADGPLEEYSPPRTEFPRTM